MKRRVVLVSFLLPIFAVGMGCRGPRLASRALTEGELEWAQIIRTSYSSWRPPYYSTLELPGTQGLRSQAAPFGVGAPVMAMPRVPADRNVDPEGGDVELVPVDDQR